MTWGIVAFAAIVLVWAAIGWHIVRDVESDGDNPFDGEGRP